MTGPGSIVVTLLTASSAGPPGRVLGSRSCRCLGVPRLHDKPGKSKGMSE